MSALTWFTWEEQKKAIRDKLEELFAVCEKNNVTNFYFEADVLPGTIPSITYKIEEYLLKKEKPHEQNETESP